MDEEKQEMLDFLTRMAGVAAATRVTPEVMVEQADLARLVQIACLAEKGKEERQQRYFERLCNNPNINFYEA